MSEQSEKPRVIDYQRPSEVVGVGSSRIVRVVAALVAMLLVLLIVYWVMKSRETLGGIKDWILPIAAAGGGACYCILIALNIVGRTRTKADRDVG